MDFSYYLTFNFFPGGAKGKGTLLMSLWWLEAVLSASSQDPKTLLWSPETSHGQFTPSSPQVSAHPMFPSFLPGPNVHLLFSTAKIPTRHWSLPMRTGISRPSDRKLISHSPKSRSQHLPPAMASHGFFHSGHYEDCGSLFSFRENGFVFNCCLKG